MQKLADDDRKYIVRVLATILTSYIRRPSMRHCGIVADSLVAKHTFLKESVSFICKYCLFNYHQFFYTFDLLQNSWKHFIYTRAQNINRKKPFDVGPRQKRLKVASDTVDKHVYAVLDFHEDDDEITKGRVDTGLKKELAKPNPKSTVVKELIKRFIKSRHDAILKCDQTVMAMLEDFPHLRKFPFVSSIVTIISYTATQQDAGINLLIQRIP